MSDQPQETGRQHGVGKTGGLPGDHADPATRRLPDDEAADSVAMADEAPVGEPADQSTDPGEYEEPS